MARKQTTTLFDDGPETIGQTERAAVADVRLLSKLGMLSTGTKALEVAYKRAAREVDRAERRRDVWASTAAMRELRSIRLELAPTAAPLAGENLSELLDQIADVVRASRERA